ncbi:uncharacterized protein LOC125370276 [Ricinus communis]|uniref:uncharacterized protein LOC125370276 n=1 Tax=Ricinus communis TaxID=3988 RepID=UPI00201A5ACC|nr:uncharacterized protein LOC125370276 [Ricinus communis]
MAASGSQIKLDCEESVWEKFQRAYQRNRMKNQQLFLCLRAVEQQGIFFVITILGSLISVKDPSQEASPFKKHEVIMTTFVVALVSYGITLSIEVKLKAFGSKYHTIFGDIRLLASSLAVVLLVIIIFPKFGWLLFGFWSCLFMWVAWNTFQLLYQLFPQRFGTQKNLAGHVEKSSLHSPGSTSKSSVDNDDNAEAAEGVVMIRVLDASAQNSAVDNLRK